jgi:hypothetical protein
MTKLMNILISAGVAGLLMLGLSSCQKTDDAADNAPAEKGSAEKVGEQIDQAAAEAAKHLNKMAEHAGKGLEKAGESLQKESKKAQENDAQAPEEKK